MSRRAVVASQGTRELTQEFPSQAAAAGPSRGQARDFVDVQNNLDFGKFGDFHRSILSVFVAYSILDTNAMRNAFRQTCAAHKVRFPEDTEDYVNMVAETAGTINHRIKKYDLMLKKVNLAPLLLQKLQEVFKPNELEYLYALVGLILDSEEGHVDTLEAMAVTTSTRTTQSVLESYLEKFRGLGFLEDEDDPKGHVVLGPRALAELEPYIREKNPDAVGNCSLCQGIVAQQGFQCRNEDCRKRCHPACLLRLIDPNSHDDSEKCPSCLEPIPAEKLRYYRQLGRQKCKEMEEELKSEQERNERIREIDAAARQQNDGSRNRRVVMAQAQDGHSDMEE